MLNTSVLIFILNNSSLLNTTSQHISDIFAESYEISDLSDEDMNQIGVPKLTQILAILGVCISMIGMLGNAFSMIVLCRKSMKKLSTYSYLLGLSICDEISLTFTVIILLHYAVPTSFFQSQSFRNNYKILLIYIYPIVSATQALSVWITLAFTVDRYIYVCHPYYGREYCSRNKALVVICCLFLLASVYSIPQYLERTYVNVDVLGIAHIFQNLTLFGRNPYFIYIYHLFVYCTFVCLIPITMIVILNGFLIFDIIKSNKKHRELSFAGSSSARSNINNLNENSIINPKKTFSKCLVFSILTGSRKNGTSGQYEQDLCCTEKFIKKKRDSNLNIIGQTVQANATNFSDKTIGNDVTIMLVGLIFVFLVCQSPSTILRLITFKNLSIYFQPMYYSSLDVSNFLIVTNSTLNCILYVMLGKKFRKEFLRTFFRKFSATPVNSFK